ncbi:MAG: fibrobacter succinogenes major paralogous domain-containing protein [Chitinispirillales bacterium]|nr:fibrobacter succinogenes major paralogous domain-containing protein [Chitinispirillales bacterium]
MKNIGRVVSAVAVMAVVVVGVMGCDGDNGTGGGNATGSDTTGGNNTGGNNVTVVDSSTVVRDTFTDRRDGRIYHTVNIETQIWMAENMNYATDSSWCYDSSSANCDKYGRLYAWTAAMMVCPTGWHLPTSQEWQTLIDYAGGNLSAGSKLKAMSGWCNNVNGTDQYGFSALPGGHRRTRDSYGNVYDDFYDIDWIGAWWSTEEVLGRRYARSRELNCNNNEVALYVREKGDALSVRCIKD